MFISYIRLSVMSILILLALPISANVAKPQNISKAMSKVALIVKFELKEGQRASFLKIMRAHATGTKRDEKGCLQFDVLIPEGNDNGVILVEMYRNDTARAIHAASPRMKITQAAYKDMIKSRSIMKTYVDEF